MAAKTKEPVRQRLVSMTGLSIVIAGSWNPAVTGQELEGVDITIHAFQQALPLPAAVSSCILMLCLAFFAFTTILGWNYYGERCVEYLANGSMTTVMVYRYLYILAIFIGPYMTVEAVWNIADIFNGLMAFPNLIALCALSGVVIRETKSYFNDRLGGEHKERP